MGLSRKERERIEDKLYSYPAYRDWLSTKPAEYAYRHVQMNLTEPAIFGNECADTTADAVLDLHSNPEYQQACRVVAKVEIVLGYLSDEERQATELTYFEENNLNYQGIARRMNVSKSAYYRHRNNALKRFALLLGKKREKDGKQSA